MARQRKRERNTKHSPLAASQPNRLARFWHPGCLMFATALLVATPLVPSERTEITGAALPYIMLWLVLALVWFAGGALLKVQPGKLSWIDAAMLALVAWQAVSGIVMQQHGAPRPTINAVWTWVSFGVIVVMLRQLLSDRRESRSLCAVMIALAVCLSVIAFYQAAITLPGDRAAYEADPEKSLSEANVHAPEGSAARKQFEARLYSSEPTATFSLTNSLAGFLAPWFVLLLGIAATRILPLPLGEGRGEGSEEEAAQGSGFRVQEFRFATFYSLLGIACLIAICLLLTKSRTAWLATLVGVAAIGAVVLFARANRRQALLAVGGFASLAAIAIFLATIFLPNVSSTAALSLK